jgi:serine/threonine protein kinase
VVPAPGVIDSGETLPTATRPVGPGAEGTGSAETKDGVEPTLFPSVTGSATVVGSGPTDPGTVVYTDPDATQVGSGGAAGPLGTDTAPASVSAGSGRAGPSPSATGTMVGRFALKDLHAAGGLGEVFKARDTELNREVAVKRIKSHYADDPGSRRRFLTEAELTARLDHPGVVPVFGLVTDVRGRPCYAMRFIRGETLKDEIDRYHKREAGDQKPETGKTEGVTAEGETAKAAPAPAPAAAVPRSVAFRHLLARFIATCQAIAYAHSRNIIHRDIKPANVMVGAFGETLVVDWGLAKALDDGPDFDRVMKAAAAAGFRHDPEATDLPSHLTLAGTAVGTPAYMAPEQAAGEVDRVAARSDVYALGATLYVILTGRAPFGGKTTAEVLDLVRRGAYAPAAEVNPECPRPLDAIAQKAMALRPEDRYATALELAADVERWLSDEPVSCYRDPLFARLARWARRHPARVATAVSLLLAGTLAAAGVAWAIHEGEKQTRAEQKRTADALERVTEQEQKTAAALVDVKRERDHVADQERKTNVQRARAEALGDIARGRYAKAVDAYNVLVKDIDKEFADLAGMQDVRRTLLTNAIAGLEKLIEGGGGQAGADATLVAAHRQMGDVYLLLNKSEKARQQFQLAVDRARDVRDEVRPDAPVSVKRAADRDLGRSLDRLAEALLRTGETGRAVKQIDEAVAVLGALAEDKTDTTAQADLAEAKARRAAILRQRGETGRAIRDADDALAVRKALADAAPNDPERARDYAASLDAVAALQLRTGRSREAVASADRALELRRALARRLPGRPDVALELAGACARLGEANVERGQLTAALKWFGEGVAELEAVVQREKGKRVTARAELAALYGLWGEAQLRTGDLTEALKNTAAGKKIALELWQADPDAVPARHGLAVAAERHGEALLAVGATAAGIKEYAESKALFGRLSAADGESAGAKLDLARGLERYADGCVANRDMACAMAALEESVELRRAAVKKDPESAGARRDLGVGLYKLAEVQCSAGRMNAADLYATEATELFLRLAAADPDSAQAQRDTALAYGKWGQVLANGGHTTGALIVWQSALDRCERLARVDAANVQALEDEAAAWERLAGFYAAVGNPERGLAAARKAVELWGAIGDRSTKTRAGRARLARALLRCGDITVEQRQFRTAAEWYDRAGAEVGTPAPDDPLLRAVAKQVDEQREYLAAVQNGLANPMAVRTAPEAVRAPALRTIMNLELRAGHTTTAGAAAEELGRIAKTAADTFAVARTFAACAAAARNPRTKKEYADDAFRLVRDALVAESGAAWAGAPARGLLNAFADVRAIKARAADALTGPDWEPLRKESPAFEQLQQELQKWREAK